jgi:hypothetical protein
VTLSGPTEPLDLKSEDLLLQRGNLFLILMPNGMKLPLELSLFPLTLRKPTTKGFSFYVHGVMTLSYGRTTAGLNDTVEG